MEILWAVLLMGGVGILFAFILGLLEKLLSQDNERESRVFSALPGYNCGACGYAGCREYATALLKGEKPTLCRPGGAETVQKIKDSLKE